MKNVCVLTAEGYVELEEEINELKTVKRPEVIIALKEARAMGDLSENADYDAARNEQAMIEAKIKDLEYRLEHCEIAKIKKNSNIVELGCSVKIEYDDGEIDELKIVGSIEADSFNGKISNESPLGKALVNNKKGSTVEVESPSGLYQVKILEIM